MKKLFFPVVFTLLILFVFTNNSYSQAPEGINYQAVVRDTLGIPLNNQPVNVRFTIHQSSVTGTIVYQETHTTSSNQFGLITREIGSGTVVSGVFSAINWGLGTYFLQVEVDAGAGYNNLGATQLISVPYALYAKTSGNGPQGLNSLIDTVGAGALCPNGGYQVLMGLDLNSNSVLDPVEITSSFFVCNGANGAVNLNDTSATNELQTLSIGTDTIFLSNGGFVVLPPAIPDNDWIIAGPNMSSGILGNVGIGTLTPGRKLGVQSGALGGDGISINNASATGNPGLEFQTQGVPQFVMGVHQSDNNKFKIGTTGVNINTRFTIDNQGNVGIGTINPIHNLTVFSPDTVIASFTGSNSVGSVISVASLNPNSAVGSLFLTGTDSAIVLLDPLQKTLFLSNTTTNGYTAITADSATALYGQVIGNIATGQIYNEAQSIYNTADTIYNFSASGTTIYANQGMFLTDSLYVLGNNATNLNWVLANDGAGQAVWTDPLTLPSSGGSLWQSNLPDIYFNTGNVGIGTNSPISPLNVLTNDTGGIITQGTNAFGTFNLTQSLVNGMAGELYISGSDTVFQSLEPLNSAFYISYDKKMGINTDSLTFSGAGPKITTSNYGDFYNQDTLFTNDLYVLNGSPLVGDILTNAGGGRLTWQSPIAPITPWTKTGPNIYPTASLTDNVAIGTTTSAFRLTVQPPSAGTVIAVNNSAGAIKHDVKVNGLDDAVYQMIDNAATMQIQLNTGGPSFFNGGFLGIGTNVPGKPLHINDPQAQIWINGTSPGILLGGALNSEQASIGLATVAGGYTPTSSINDFVIRTSTAGGNLLFATGASFIERMRIDATGNVGIGTTSPSSSLDVVGTLQYQDGTEGAGKLLTSDATGNATWQLPPPPINFSANTSSTIIPNAVTTGLVFNNVEYNNGGNFNIASGQFVASEPGVYHVDATITFDSSVNHEIQIQILRNGGTHKTVVVYADATKPSTTAHISADVFLPVFNSVSIGIYQNSGGAITTTASGGGSRVYFTGHLIR